MTVGRRETEADRAGLTFGQILEVVAEVEGEGAVPVVDHAAKRRLVRDLVGQCRLRVVGIDIGDPVGPREWGIVLEEGPAAPPAALGARR